MYKSTVVTVRRKGGKGRRGMERENTTTINPLIPNYITNSSSIAGERVTRGTRA